MSIDNTSCGALKDWEAKTEVAESATERPGSGGAGGSLRRGGGVGIALPPDGGVRPRDLPGEKRLEEKRIEVVVVVVAEATATAAVVVEVRKKGVRNIFLNNNNGLNYL